LHPTASDGISAPHEIMNTPEEPFGCFFKAAEQPGKPHHIHINLPTLPGAHLTKFESLLCMSESVMAEIAEKKAEAASKNFPLQGKCAPGYKPKSGGLPNFGSCTGSYATGYCILPPVDAKKFCDDTPECAGTSETSDATWIKTFPKMQQIGKVIAEKDKAQHLEEAKGSDKWTSCEKGEPVDPCVKTASMSGAEVVALVASLTGANGSQSTTATKKSLLELDGSLEADTVVEPQRHTDAQRQAIVNSDGEISYYTSEEERKKDSLAAQKHAKLMRRNLGPGVEELNKQLSLSSDMEQGVPD